MARRYWRIQEGHRSEGVDVTYDSAEQTIAIGGWYDSMVGIEPVVMPVLEFVERLNLRKAIAKADKRALEEVDAK